MSTEEIVIIVLGSSVVATLVNKGWDYFSQRAERENERVENLYGPLRFHLMVMSSLDVNKKELMEESLKTKRDVPETYRKEVDSLIRKWWEHAGIIQTVIQSNVGYVKKKHVKLVADFIDGWIKRDIIGTLVNKGTVLTNKERMGKIIDTIEAMKEEFLK